ncbi:glycosyltransferase family 2 protein [Desulfurispirillum indicum]|uniref:glycosyltransferase family 2 protein n=1 Tax=Desulfurispirillum indicum TaxID=936456 RepID=UPI001CF9E02B|nr:glycosyltransferase family 2 protein [Desulfurispirillum indicum]UCZ56949.1 glycosyltransferase family 2 protein [Desulfurispirillum indicum]
MKLKELPGSLLTGYRLARMPIETLHTVSGECLPVIVTLTSIPSRLKTLHLTIRSLLAQRAKAQKVILWLNGELKGTLPDSLLALEGPLFEVRFAGMTCSHRKLVYSLDAFPGSILVTCDDDVMYDSQWLELLYRDHLKHPEAIIAHECRRITCDIGGKVLPYKQWPMEENVDTTAPNMMPIGYGGVLYPPGCLFRDVCNAELYLQLTPRADDIWFKAMSFLQGTPVRRCSVPARKPLPIAGSQRISLKKTNVRRDGNREQWEAVSSHYGIRCVDGVLCQS